MKTHIIKNFEQLATSPLRRQALEIVEAGYAAINTKEAITKLVHFQTQDQVLEVDRVKYRLKDFERVICVGFGKAAFDAVAQIQQTLSGFITCGYVIDLKEGNLGNIVCKIGTHPYPTKINIEATQELMAMLENCSDKDLVLCVVSGGGSALLCDPHDMSCEQEVSIIAALTVKGASIAELNTVRKHISKVKGGLLAKSMYPATVISFIFSDVPGNDISMVASGPTVLDKTTSKDAADIIAKYKVLETLELPSVKLIETPKDEKYFKKVRNLLVVSSKNALLAMKEKAENLGFEVKIFSEAFQGEARELGPKIAAENRAGQCLLGTGESTVHITGKGLGGRNQEMALAAMTSLKQNQVLVCAASDGHDNTDAAGAIADSFSAECAEQLGLDVNQYLQNNDSYHFFESLGGQLITGLTEANVSDFFVCLRG